MNTAIVSSIIGTVGAAFIAVLVFFLRALRDDIRAVGARIDKVESGVGERFDKVDTHLGGDRRQARSHRNDPGGARPAARADR